MDLIEAHFRVESGFIPRRFRINWGKRMLSCVSAPVLFHYSRKGLPISCYPLTSHKLHITRILCCRW